MKNRYIILIVGVLSLGIIGLYIVSGQTSPEQTTTDVDNAQQSFVDTYTFAAEVQPGTGEIHDMTIIAQPQQTTLLPQGKSTAILNYTTGTQPLMIRVTKGDTLRLTIDNRLGQSTSIHRHGLRIPNREDGVPGVTQEEIPDGETYTYTLPLHDVGTFRFHPHTHHEEQIGKGLYGIIVVEEKTPPVFDQEWVRALKDYRLGSDGDMLEDFGNMHDRTHAGRIGNVMTINNQYAPTYNVKQGDRIRIRMINTSNAKSYHIPLNGMDAYIIATDGGYTDRPYAVEDVTLFPGERIELDVRIVTSEDIVVVDDHFGQKYRFPLGRIVVEGINNSPANPMIDHTNIPDRSSLVDRTPDKVITLGGINVMGGDQMGRMHGQQGWTINGGLWGDNHTPIVVTSQTMYTIRFKNNSYQDHPMHVHGDFFQVLSIGGKAPSVRGWKDTVNVPANSYVDIAMIPTNIGKWMLHCHILGHAAFGMMTILDVQES